MGVEPMNTGFADLQGAFALVCPRFVPIVYSTDYRFHFQRIQAHLNRHPLHSNAEPPAGGLSARSDCIETFEPHGDSNGLYRGTKMKTNMNGDLDEIPMAYFWYPFLAI